MSSQPTSMPTSTKAAVTLHPTAHLADGALVRGPNPITISPDVLIHPRAIIFSVHAPLSIASSTLINTKAIIGAPLPKGEALPLTLSRPSTTAQPKPILIGKNVHIHPHAVIYHSVTIHDNAIIESHAVLLPGAVIGQHSKICSGITISSSIPEWTVVYGNGELRRLRKPLSTSPTIPPKPTTTENAEVPANTAIQQSLAKLEGTSSTTTTSTITQPLLDINLPETHRLISLSKEREAATWVLRNNVPISTLSRQKSQVQSTTSRESVSLEKGR